MGDIYCDEAGNSGENLLDPEQPTFALASTDLRRQEAVELLASVRSAQGGEPKFKTLKKTPDGVRRLTGLLTDPRMNKARIALTVFHKRYMVVTKLVDLIAESVYDSIGEDLYKRGANIAMSNMLYYCMPAFCGVENTDRFLASFVSLMRFRRNEHVREFYAAGDAMLKASTDEQFRDSLFPFTDPRLFSTWFEGIGPLALDPAIPALFQHIAVWGVRKPDRFKVVHDNSKPILASQRQFEEMMAQSNEISMMVGYDRRKFNFPLQATALEQADSRDHPQLQIADICAGAMAHFVKCRETGQLDELASIVRDHCLEWAIDAIMPTTDVSPQELGTDSDDGANPIESLVERVGPRRK
jgi:hypothetical protein